MSTGLTIVLGIVSLIIVCIVDNKVVYWILNGGLNTRRRRFLLLELPVVLYFGLYFAYTLIHLFWWETADLAWYPWLKGAACFIGLFYGIGFALFYFKKEEPWANEFALFKHLTLTAIFLLPTGASYLDYAKIRFNLSPSMPSGIYVLEPVKDQPQRGDMVTFCLESDNPLTALALSREYIGPGSCPSGLKPLLKRLGGLPGDVISVSSDGIMLNGKFLAGSARPEYDSQGRVMPPTFLEDGTIPEGMALVISQKRTNSFDSRFFGLVPFDSLTKVSPVMIAEEKPLDDDN